MNLSPGKGISGLASLKVSMATRIITNYRIDNLNLPMETLMLPSNVNKSIFPVTLKSVCVIFGKVQNDKRGVVNGWLSPRRSRTEQVTGNGKGFAAEKRKVVWKRGGVIPEKEKDPIIRYAQKTPRNSTRNTLKKDSAFIHSRKLILKQRTLKFFKCAGGGRCE
jgi:hypothetical protein